ncbi:hypothetical protein SDRG_05760 [Saprolegnia diclina VS20]|uniref:Uncharacterized protein n=1 Tax=Saprolegnia diclina (strain VS20) TaxID=1156394 RepID=T0QG66_SAPDV|nr:hypothetical protein SDRG_05760 [Saprolegnia diclina VS20]EQC36934.1 hypothetical protein SDRG_05760 [Saprolegnia diclina VS20]|eukprot:XP_008609715.1 hypothetical protein SDRG_05760 [Saprolegnia diclina VS20]
MASVQGRSKALWKKLSTSIKMSQLDEVQQRKFQQAQTESLEKAGADVTLNDSSSGDADDAGHEMYSKDALALRYSLRKDRRIDDVVRRLWALEADRDELGCLRKEGYMAFYVSVAKYLDAAFDDSAALASVASEWDNDRKGQDTMSYALFFESLFQLVDVWVDSLDVRDYIGFLEHIALNIFLPGTTHLRDVHDIIFINASATDRTKLEKLRAKKELAKGKELERSAKRDPRSAAKAIATTSKTAPPTSTVTTAQAHAIGKIEIAHKAAPKRVSPAKRGVPSHPKSAAAPTKASSYVPAQADAVARNVHAHSNELGFDGDDVSGSLAPDNDPPRALRLGPTSTSVATPSPAHGSDPNLVAQFLAAEASDVQPNRPSQHGLSSHNGKSTHAAANGHAFRGSDSTFGSPASSTAPSLHPHGGATAAATHGASAGSNATPRGHGVATGGLTSGHATTFATAAQGDVFSPGSYAQDVTAASYAGQDHHATSSRFDNDAASSHASGVAGSGSGATATKVSVTAAASSTNAVGPAPGTTMEAGDDPLQMGDGRRSNKTHPSGGQRAKLHASSNQQHQPGAGGSLSPANRSHEGLEDARPMARGLAGKPVDPLKAATSAVHRSLMASASNSTVALYEPQHDLYDDGSHRRPLSTYVLEPQGFHLRPRTSPVKHDTEFIGVSVTQRHGVYDATPLKLEWQGEKPDMEQLEFAVVGGRLAVSKHRWLPETCDHPHGGHDDDRVIDVSHFDATDDEALLDDETSTSGRRMDDINELRNEFQRRQLQPISTENPPRVQPRFEPHRDLMPLQTSLSRQTLQVPAMERRQRLRNVSSLPVLPRRQRTPPSVPRGGPVLGLELASPSARLGPNRIELLKKKQRVLSAHLQSAPLKDSSWHAPDT